MNLQDFLNQRRQAELVIQIYEQLLEAITVPDSDDPLYDLSDADKPIMIVRDGIRRLIDEQHSLLKPLNEYELYESPQLNKITEDVEEEGEEVAEEEED